MSNTIYHRHHIIPKHAGGTDDDTNIVYLTIEEHAEAHRILFEKYGRWQDELAWKGLAKLITHDQAILMASIKGNQGKIFSKKHRQGISDGLKNHVVSNKTRQKISQTRKDKNIPSPRLGVNLTAKTKQLLSEKAKQRNKIQCKCGKIVDVSNYARWHKNC